MLIGALASGSPGIGLAGFAVVPVASAAGLLAGWRTLNAAPRWRGWAGVLAFGLAVLTLVVWFGLLLLVVLAMALTAGNGD